MLLSAHPLRCILPALLLLAACSSPGSTPQPGPDAVVTDTQNLPDGSTESDVNGPPCKAGAPADCTSDYKALKTCDPISLTWSITPCPGGCSFLPSGAACGAPPDVVAGDAPGDVAQDVSAPSDVADAAAETAGKDSVADTDAAGSDATSSTPIGSDWPQWKLPGESPGAASYVVAGDGTVLDKTTGLQWQQTAEQKTPWPKAAAYCAALQLGGFDDWRVPQRIELVTLLDDGQMAPPYGKQVAIDATAFPGTPAAIFWSATVSAVSGSNWVVDFGFGDVDLVPVGAPTTAALPIRCVRNSVAVTPGPQYAVTVDTVLDNKTGLTWLRNVGAPASSIIIAKEFCNNLALAGGGWRLPTKKELLSIVDSGGKAPTIDAVAFPDTPTIYAPSNAGFPYMTSTALAATDGTAGWSYWGVDFSNGSSHWYGDLQWSWVRCVR